eukprot:1332422-Amorphochlora_amoeboformis.AAC.1
MRAQTHWPIRETKGEQVQPKSQHSKTESKLPSMRSRGKIFRPSGTLVILDENSANTPHRGHAILLLVNPNPNPNPNPGVRNLGSDYSACLCPKTIDFSIGVRVRVRVRIRLFSMS